MRPTESSYFEQACNGLEQLTSLNRLEARGTVRIALKASGFDARSANRPQILAAIMSTLPDELRRRGVDNFGEVCDRLANHVADRRQAI